MCATSASPPAAPSTWPCRPPGCGCSRIPPPPEPAGSHAMATPTLALPSQPAATPLKQQLGRDDWIMRGALVALGVWLVLTVLLPLWSLLSKSFQAADGSFVGLAN